MDPCSEKWLSPSKSTASPKPSSTRENNENDPSQQDKLILKFQDQNKPFAKHFMSPTISAASKAAPPRNKILSERNENSFNSDFQIPKTEKKKYDPLTNYLSPRPKYLRFNPNRRREIFTRLEKKELNDSSSSGSHSQEVNDEESVVNPETEENNNLEGDEKNICNDHEDENGEEDEDGEEEEDSGWRSKGLLKFVLTLIVFVLSTSYICTMNSSQQQEEVWPKVKDGFFMIKRQTLEVVGMKIWENKSLKIEIGEDYNEFEEGAFEADDNVGITEDDGVENLEVVEINGDENPEIEESINLVAVENGVENLEVVEINGDENPEIEESINLVAVENGVENLEVVEMNGDENPEIEESINLVAVENGVENLEVVEVFGDENRQIEEGVEKFDGDLVENEIEDSSDQSEVKAKSSDRSVDAKTDEFVNAEFASPSLNEDYAEKIEAAESEIESETESYDQSTAAKADESENAEEYGPEMEIKGSDQPQDLIDDIVKENERVGRMNEAIISGVAMILASLAIAIYRFKKSRITFEEKFVPVVMESHKLAAVVEEKKKIEFIARPSVLDSTEEAPKKLDRGSHKLAAVVEENKKIEFIARPSVLDSTEEAPKKIDRFVYAPSVELIGEIVVGRASNANNYKLDQPVLAKTQMSVNEYSNISSRSFGSFTTESKSSKKEQIDKSGERAVESTPVRRSSRLRSRAAAMSP